MHAASVYFCHCQQRASQNAPCTTDTGYDLPGFQIQRQVHLVCQYRRRSSRAIYAQQKEYVAKRIVTAPPAAAPFLAHVAVDKSVGDQGGGRAASSGDFRVASASRALTFDNMASTVKVLRIYSDSKMAFTVAAQLYRQLWERQATFSFCALAPLFQSYQVLKQRRACRSICMQKATASSTSGGKPTHDHFQHGGSAHLYDFL